LNSPCTPWTCRAGTGQSIQIQGSTVCWNVILSNKTFCDCAVNVTVQFVYQTCLECNYPQAYKITECTTGDVIYTTSDLSNYLDKGVTINIDCGGCWYIEAIEGIPPSDQPVVVEAALLTPAILTVNVVGVNDV